MAAESEGLRVARVRVATPSGIAYPSVQPMSVPSRSLRRRLAQGGRIVACGHDAPPLGDEDSVHPTSREHTRDVGERLVRANREGLPRHDVLTSSAAARSPISLASSLDAGSAPPASR